MPTHLYTCSKYTSKTSLNITIDFKVLNITDNSVVILLTFSATFKTINQALYKEHSFHLASRMLLWFASQNWAFLSVIISDSNPFHQPPASGAESVLWLNHCFSPLIISPLLMNSAILQIPSTALSIASRI